MTERAYTPLRQEVLEGIAAGKLQTYSFEAKAMALELLELRQKQAPPAPNFDWAAFLP